MRRAIRLGWTVHAVSTAKSLGLALLPFGLGLVLLGGVGCDNSSGSLRFAFNSGTGESFVGTGIGRGRVFGREYLFYIPPDYNGQRVPLVVAFHGAGEEASEMIALYRRLADDEPFIILAPEFVSQSDLLPPPYGTDTVGIVETMIDDVQFRFAIDPNRRYLSGFSIGGSVSYILALLNASEFAAASVWAGGYTGTSSVQAQLLVDSASRRIPIYAEHGVNDGVFPIAPARIARDTLQSAGHPALLVEHTAGHGIPGTSEQDAWAFLRGFSL